MSSNTVREPKEAPSSLMEELAGLRFENERYRIASENSSEIILDFNILDGSIHHVTRRVEAIYGVPQHLENALAYLTHSGCILEESVEDFLEMFRQVTEAGADQAQCAINTRTTDGALLWGEIILTAVRDEKGNPVRAIGVLKDISRQKEAELQYETELLYRSAMQQNAIMSYEVDLTNLRVVSGVVDFLASRSLPETDDYPTVLELIVTHLIYEEDQGALMNIMSAEALLSRVALGDSKVELEYRRVDEEGLPLWVKGTCYLTDDVQGGIVRAFYFVQDINESKLRELRLREEAERDLLTGLYNKATTERLIRETLDREKTEYRMGALLLLDLDNFKQINDSLGHAFGDAVLAETARDLRRLCGEGDVPGRIGGDEFVLFLWDIARSGEAEDTARRLCARLGRSVGGGVRLSGSVGVALRPEHGTSFEALYQRADLAMYEAKKQGKNAYMIASEA